MVGADGIFIVMGDLGFERSHFLLELLICMSESISFNAMDGITMLKGGNEPFCDFLGAFS